MKQTRLFTEETLPLATIFSDDRTFRYVLTRSWNLNAPSVMFIGLNPSTADESKDDPTIRRCVGFAKAWGYGHLIMTNLFAIRSPHPQILKTVEDPIGPDNDYYLQTMAQRAAGIVAAWGIHGAYLERGAHIHHLIPHLWVFGFTQNGQPGHPLYMPKNSPLKDWPTPTPIISPGGDRH
jgi:hypothetical protein